MGAFFYALDAEAKATLGCQGRAGKEGARGAARTGLKILDYLRDHGRVTTRDLVREVGASPNTLKVTFGNLVEKNLIVRHGAGRSIWYGLP